MNFSRHILAALLILGFSTCGCSMCGCMPVISWITANFARPKEVEAVYELPKDKRVLVLVEAKDPTGGYETVKRDLTTFINRQLLEHDLVGNVVPYDALMALRFSTGEYHRREDMPITAIGEKLEADLVVYVLISEFALKDNPVDVLWHGQFSAYVKVVKVAPGIRLRDARLWPTRRHRRLGYPVDPVDRGEIANSSADYGARLTTALSADMADHIAKLFYDHRLSGIEGIKNQASDKEDPIQ